MLNNLTVRSLGFTCLVSSWYDAFYFAHKISFLPTKHNFCPDPTNLGPDPPIFAHQFSLRASFTPKRLQPFGHVSDVPKTPAHPPPPPILPSQPGPAQPGPPFQPPRCLASFTTSSTALLRRRTPCSCLRSTVEAAQCPQSLPRPPELYSDYLSHLCPDPRQILPRPPQTCPDPSQLCPDTDPPIRNIFFSPAFFTFLQKAHFFQTPSLFPHMTFQNLGYVIKRAAAFRVCPPNVLG